MRKLSFLLSMTLPLFISPSSAWAQNAAELEAKMNQSSICAPLKFDALTIAKLLGISVPSLPIHIDTTIGWDKNAHKVKSLIVDTNSKLSSEIELGCQPSAEGAVLKLLNLKPEQVRLNENVKCTGTVRPDGAVPDLSCKPSGEIGKLLGAIHDLDGQMRPLFQSVLSHH